MAGYQAFQRGFKRAIKGEERPEEFTWQDALPNVVFFGALISLLTALLEPESSQHLNFLTSFMHWFLHYTPASVLWLAAFVFMIRREIPARIFPWIAIFITPFIFSAVSLVVDLMSGIEEESYDAWYSPFFWYLSELGGVGGNALLMGGFLTLVVYATDAAADELPPARPTPLPGSTPPALHRTFSNIPPARDTLLIRAEAQDHYVALVTSTGTHLVLMPFSEAVEKLAVYNGLQCHRSLWLMRDQVHDLRRAGSACECEMENGDIVPVSRRRARDVRETLSPA